MPENKRKDKIALFNVETGDMEEVDPVERSEDEWQGLLTEEQFRIMRRKGTERAFTGAYHDTKDEGYYRCIGCGTDLFSSRAKFDSGTGWPSFSEPVAEGNVATKSDTSFFMRKTEVLCPRCSAHLGHVFDDGPPPTGRRFCINSASLRFEPSQKKKA